MVEMFRHALMVQPILNVLFANSPFRARKLAGCRGARTALMNKAGNQQLQSLISCVFSRSFGFREYVDWSSRQSLLFVRNDFGCVGLFPMSWKEWLYKHNTQSFRVEGGCSVTLEASDDGYKITPSIQSWIDHQASLPVPVRLTRMLEIETGDSCGTSFALAQAVFWKGILSDPFARKQATSLMGGSATLSDPQSIYHLHMQVPGLGGENVLQITGTHGSGKMSIQELAARLLQIAHNGLTQQNDKEGTRSLYPLLNLVHQHINQSDELLHRCQSEWGGDVSRIFIHPGKLPQ